MNMDGEIREIAFANGCDFFGMADLQLATDFVKEQGGEIVGHYPFAISIGIRLMDSIVDLLPERSKIEVAKSYRMHCYDVVNHRLNMAVSVISSAIQKMGFEAFPIPASQTIDTKNLKALFSHKLAAHLAGLGWIGKSCLLITPEAGPRIRLATILTDAPLQDVGQPIESRCGACQECVTSCPENAFTGKNFLEQDAREVRYDAHRCEKYHEILKAQYGIAACGLCIYSCPHGRRRKI